MERWLAPDFIEQESWAGWIYASQIGSPDGRNPCFGDAIGGAYRFLLGRVGIRRLGTVGRLRDLAGWKEMRSMFVRGENFASPRSAVRME